MYVYVGLVCLIDDEDGDCGGGGGDGDECDGVLGVTRGTPSLALLQKRTRGEGKKASFSCLAENPIPFFHQSIWVSFDDQGFILL